MLFKQLLYIDSGTVFTPAFSPHIAIDFGFRSIIIITIKGESKCRCKFA